MPSFGYLSPAPRYIHICTTPRLRAGNTDEKASKPLTKVQDKVLSMTPLDIFREVFGQLPMVFVATKKKVFYVVFS